MVTVKFELSDEVHAAIKRRLGISDAELLFLIKEGTMKLLSNNTPSEDKHFEALWRLYPNKAYREDAYDEFARHSFSIADLAGLISALRSQVDKYALEIVNGKRLLPWPTLGGYLANKLWQDSYVDFLRYGWNLPVVQTNIIQFPKNRGQ